MSKPGLLERLCNGVVLGDGGFTFGLEKRGYVRGGAWTPECTVLHPEPVKQYHREFLRGGSDVMQAFNFYSTQDKLDLAAGDLKPPSSEAINKAACRIAREVASEGEALVSASISETPSYREGKTKEAVVQQFRNQVDFLKTCDIDFVICEYFGHVEEMEWAIEEALKTGKPVVASMRIGPDSDLKGVPTGECAVRMAKAGAKVVGINCNFGPTVSLKSMRVVKAALDKAELHPYLIVQPLGYFTPDVDHKEGYLQLPETPFALEPRMLTRFEAMRFAREAFDLGIRYIGGCCGFEPYHIRAMAEELSEERGRLPPASQELGLICGGLKKSIFNHINNRDSKTYWQSFEPSTGRPFSAALSKTSE